LETYILLGRSLAWPRTLRAVLGRAFSTAVTRRPCGCTSLGRPRHCCPGDAHNLLRHHFAAL